MPALHPVLRTWEDHLWARISVAFEERLQKVLNTLPGFWQGKTSSKKTRNDMEGVQAEIQDEEEWADQIIRLFKELENIKVDER